MKALIAALALVFAVGATLPAVADAQALDKAQRWGLTFRTLAGLGEECDLDPHCEGTETFTGHADLDFGRAKNKYGERFTETTFRSIRVSIMRVRPGMKWDQRVQRRIWRNARIKAPCLGLCPEIGFDAPASRFDCDPVGTRYFVKVRIERKPGAKIVWLKSDPTQMELRLPWKGCPS